MSNKSIFRAALVGTLLLASVSAQAVVFLNFGPIAGSPNGLRNFRYDNQDTKRRGVVTPGAEIFSIIGAQADTPDVTVTALQNGSPSSGVLAGDTFTASFFLDAFNNGPVTGAGTVGDPFRQLFDGEISFYDQGSGANLLTADFTSAVLSGVRGSRTFTLTGNSTDGLDYTSDVFSTGSGRSFTITGLRLTSAIALKQFGGSLKDFRALVGGDFSASSVPEPAVLTLFGLGLLGIGLRRRAA